MYLNEIDLKAAAWLRELFPTAMIDERSIADVTGSDVAGFRRVHFFAGIGGWERAISLAGVPADFPIWTGSCPCQPFSTAGKRKGEADERHLWPEMRRLIAECMPPIVFGEQVARGPGREWLARVRADLEALGYVVGAADLCAAGVSAPHIRQRLYWGAIRMGDGGIKGLWGHGGTVPRAEASRRSQWNSDGNCTDQPVITGDNRRDGWMGDPIQQGPQGQWPGIRGGSDDRRGGQQAAETGCACGVSDAERYARESRRAPNQSREGATTTATGAHAESGRCCVPGGIPDADRQRCDGIDVLHGSGWVEDPETARGGKHGGVDDPAVEGPFSGAHTRILGEEAGATQQRGRNGWRSAGSGCDGFWSQYDVIPFIDGKARRIESGTLPLVAGLPRGVGYSSDPGVQGYAQNTAEARVMRLHGYGNAIVPQLAAVFIRCFLDAVRSMFGLPANAGEGES